VINEVADPQVCRRSSRAACQVATVSQKLQLELDVVLPQAHNGHDQCVTELVNTLGRFDGVDAVHVIVDDPIEDERIEDDRSDGSATICLHLKPGAVSVSQLTERVRTTGTKIDSRCGHLPVQPTATDNDNNDGLDSGHDDHDEGDSGHGHGGHGHVHGHGASKVELGAAIISLIVYLVARGLDWFSDLDQSVTTMYVVAAVVVGVFVARDAWLSVRARVFDIDQLMLVAAVGAAFIGHWSDSALLLVLFSLGHALEGYAMNRARTAIEALGEMAPATARLKDDPTSEVSVTELVIGDVVIVRPNERIPADGVIVVGQTAIDESPITGESVPVDKTAIADLGDALVGMEAIAAEHRAFAGTLNGPGAVELMVLRVAADSTLARVVQLVAEAETQISPTQRFTKRIVGVFVPAVLALVVFLLVVPPLAGEPFSESFARAMAVLVAASPCALAIATPSAVLAAIARAARAGILVKGGGPLEALGTVNAVAFDKTGTLTEGRPVLTDVEPMDPSDEPALLMIALVVERLSDHPIARAITTGIEPRFADQSVPEASDVAAVDGKGVTATVDGAAVMIGNLALFDAIEVPEAVRTAQSALESRGRTTMIVWHGQRFLGVLGVMDTPRHDARRTVESLRELGIAKIVMLSGDNQRVATAVAKQVGITDATGGLLPADKLDEINKLSEEHGVAMIGDGVNDAPALAAADVGLAMGAAGSDVALETADIALLADQLTGLPTAIGLARRASRTIKQNLYFSLGVVAVLIPATIAGVGISVAVIAHEGSTIVVVVNALRLLRYNERKRK